MNRKGFMMAEVVVVSSIVLMVIAILFISYNNIYSEYKKQISYYDTVTLYKLAYYRDGIADLETIKQSTKNSSSKVTSIPASDLEKVFLIYNGRSKQIDKDILNNEADINATFKDYVVFLSTSVNLGNAEYVMLMENCIDDNKCKYAYLELS